MSSHAWQHTPAEMKAAKEASRKARQEEHNASRKLLRAAERDSQHAAAIRLIDAALVVAERPGQTVPQLITAHETLQQVGVGDGGWQSLVCHMPGYGLPLQEAIARMGACLARMRWRIATQVKESPGLTVIGASAALCFALAATLFPTLPCRGARAMQPRRALQRLWALARSISFILGVCNVGIVAARLATATCFVHFTCMPHKPQTLD